MQFGGLSMSAESPWWTRASEREEVAMPSGGFLHSGVAGRTDRIPAAVAADSFVLPAAEVSGLGQGNSLAGARLWSMALGIGPYGSRFPHEARGPGPPSHHASPPSPPAGVMKEIANYSAGGREAGKKASVMLAGGELVVPPEIVAEKGGGDLKKGHQILREAVKRVREDTIKRLGQLPPPKS